MGAYICQNFQNVHFKYVQFIVCQLHLNKAVFKNKKSKYYAYTLIPTLRIYHKESEVCAKM